jgi:uncharacterized membrane protein
LWSDEAYSALLSLESPTGILNELAKDSSPPLFYILLRGWHVLTGGESVTLRLLPAIAGVVGVYLAIRLGTLLWGESAGVRNGLLLAISPLHLYYSQELRPYSLLLVFSSLALIGLAGLTRSSYSTWRGGGLYCSGVLLASYTHNYGLFLLLPLLVETLQHRIRPRIATMFCAAILAGYAPWIPFFIRQVRTGAAVWVARIWEQTPPALALPKTLAAYVVGGAVPAYIPIGSMPLAIWIHIAAYAVFAFLIGRSLMPVIDRVRTAKQMTLWLCVLLGVPYALSFLIPIYVVGRYDIIALPVFLALAARGWDEVPTRQAIVLGVAVACLSVVALWAYFSRAPLQGARAQAALLAAHARSDDAVLAIGPTRNPLEYYLRDRGVLLTFFSFPSSFDQHRGWMDERELSDPIAASLDAASVMQSVTRRQPPQAGLWVVHSRLLGDAATLMLTAVNRSFLPVPCPAHAETLGLSCWKRRFPTIER